MERREKEGPLSSSGGMDMSAQYATGHATGNTRHGMHYKGHTTGNTLQETRYKKHATRDTLQETRYKRQQVKPNTRRVLSKARATHSRLGGCQWHLCDPVR